MLVNNPIAYFVCAGILLIGIIFLFFYSHYKKTHRNRVVDIAEIILIIAFIIFIVKGIVLLF
jgi:hypothetical protein